eukprot:CAMPEP_0115281350 /NCGR_PEP_ID=MMETSP0270-20121206/59276_1 /TAXON_ID=71861 /ORGANISM="Scrippsiella trochoidea, Strain CCMP3099" /LENGTH=120 /DNA_ID=CAMNT_0002698151 /DNA_START=80 /DNA_END=439 /DNA_ORIENTATION=+
MAPTRGSDMRSGDPLPNVSSDAFVARHDLKNKRSTVAEMKRINALNLEPSLPSAVDAGRNPRFATKDPQTARGGTRGDNLKQEFEQSLYNIKRKSAEQQWKKSGAVADLTDGDAAKSNSF